MVIAFPTTSSPKNSSASSGCAPSLSSAVESLLFPSKIFERADARSRFIQSSAGPPSICRCVHTPRPLPCAAAPTQPHTATRCPMPPHAAPAPSSASSLLFSPLLSIQPTPSPEQTARSSPRRRRQHHFVQREGSGLAGLGTSRSPRDASMLPAPMLLPPWMQPDPMSSADVAFVEKESLPVRVEPPPH